MKRLYTICAALFISISCAFADEPTSDQIAEGHALAQKLRHELLQARPEADSQFTGTLIITHNGKKHVPVVCKILANPGGDWKMIYESKAADGIPAERFVITRTPNGNRYAYARAPSVDAPCPEPKPIPTAQAYVPFAQSDFWLTDLGTEFIFWPQQARLKPDVPLRLGREYYLLESVNSAAGQIVRIKSYIDKESDGILAAEGYDSSNKLVKEFSIHGSSFKKVNGIMRLEKMDMHNAKTGSQTVLKFDLSKE
jgi:hypothetical protein